MKCKARFFRRVCLLLFAAMLLQGCVPAFLPSSTSATIPQVSAQAPSEYAQAMTREDIAEGALAGYDAFYQNPRIQRDANPWFDILYETREITFDEETLLYGVRVNYTLYPKYKEPVTFWAYEELEEPMRQYLNLTYDRLVSWADEETVPPFQLPTEPGATYEGGYTGCGSGMTKAIKGEIILDAATEAEILQALNHIKLHIVVDHNGRRETYVVDCLYE